MVTRSELKVVEILLALPGLITTTITTNERDMIRAFIETFTCRVSSVAS